MTWAGCTASGRSCAKRTSRSSTATGQSGATASREPRRRGAGVAAAGRVVVEAGAPGFHRDWEGRVYGIMRAAMARGIYNIDEMRHGIERVPPAEYLASSYCERWLASA